MMHRKVGVVQNREAPATSAPPGCCQSPASVRVGEQGEKMKINLLGRRQLTFHVFVSSYTASHQYNAPLGKIGGLNSYFASSFVLVVIQHAKFTDCQHMYMIQECISGTSDLELMHMQYIYNMQD
jgi:hypothetical protein